MFSPASNPAAVTSQRLLQRPVNGTFTVDLQSPAAEAYRVFVVADFEPANLDGVVLVDEADAPLRSTARRRHRRLTVQRQPSAGPPAPTACRQSEAQRGSGGGASGPRDSPTISGKLTPLARRDGAGVPCRNHVAWGRRGDGRTAATQRLVRHNATGFGCRMGRAL